MRVDGVIRRSVGGLLIIALLATPGKFSTVALAEENSEGSRWESAIRAFEEQDRKSPPPVNAILFLGSSSIRGWDLPKYFPGIKAINRGFGGSHISDSVEFASRIVIPCKPRVIVFYAGDNDIAAGKSAETVLKDFKTFARIVHENLPKTQIVFISIKPSIQRWRLVGEMRKANKLIQTFTEADERLRYVDIDSPMIGKDGKPRPELFVDDGLHLNAAGYKLWTSLVLPHLRAAEKAAGAKP